MSEIHVLMIDEWAPMAGTDLCGPFGVSVEEVGSGHYPDSIEILIDLLPIAFAEKEGMQQSCIYLDTNAEDLRGLIDKLEEIYRINFATKHLAEAEPELAKLRLAELESERDSFIESQVDEDEDLDDTSVHDAYAAEWAEQNPNEAHELMTLQEALDG